MLKEFKNQLNELLKKDKRLWDEKKTELNMTLLVELVEKIDEKLIGLLLEKEEIRDKFFVKINEAYVFKTKDFKFFMEEHKINNSFTAYKNRIGLTAGGRYLKDINDVVLNFPYKDCVLEGGQSDEEGIDTYYEWKDTTYKDKLNEEGEKIKDGRRNAKEVDEDGHYEEKASKRKEIFFNQVLAQDEIDRLFDEKALVNWKRFTREGEQEVKTIRRDERGTIKENLIIKGNNLLALHSLESQFTGKVKLIYIDPPYNTGNDGFGYNDNFNHSTWLAFMKNRLEIARELLRDDGVILVQCDHHEMGYLVILLDEIFGISNKIQQIAVKVASASGFKAVNPGPIDVLENILYYAKDKKRVKFERNYVSTGYNKNYNKYLDNSDSNPDNWKIISLKQIVLIHNGYENEKAMKEKKGTSYKIELQQLIEKYAYDNADNVISIRDLHKPTKQVKELQNKSKIERDKIFIYKKQNGEETYIINGGAIAFYSAKIVKIDGKMEVAELLTNFWDHISWAGIANEGRVKLKNGKKPEKLIKQILEISTSENDFVLDFFAGSGTTCAASHKMNRRYIGIEQLEYGDNSGLERLKYVVNGDQTGISKAVNWQGGGDFIYVELAKWNERAMDQIEACETLEGLVELFKAISERYFLNYNVKVKEFREKVIEEENFKGLSLEEQKEMVMRMLDLNQMYVLRSEMRDQRYGIREQDMVLTEQFYGGEQE